ncbi:hypothetical protein ACIRSU_03390 [Streptomyces sp. NPDC101160]|uniref:hypothetical protein n=1 Tax=Streptomyces sp. NPDC101160 TaxID=3366118 RepID=UPI003800222C
MADPLTDAQQDVQKYRDLLRDNPQSPERNTWRDALAAALCDRLAPALRPTRPDDAAAAAREGVGITQQLLAENAFPQSRQGFAKRIAEAAGFLPATEAVTATESAVAVYRELSDARPDDPEQLGWLAWVLAGRLAPRQAAAQQAGGAAQSAREAVQLTQRILAGPELPPNAAGHAQLIADVAQYLPPAEAVTATSAAVAVYRRLSAADPANLRLRDQVAEALAGRLAPRQAAAGQRDGAAASAREAIQITKDVIQDPAAQANLLGYARRILMVADYLPDDEMLAETEFAVGLYRRVAHQDPHNEGVTRDLVWAMGVWADRLDRTGRHKAAKAVRDDAAKVARYGEHSLFAGDVRFPPLTPVSVVSRHIEQLDVFAVGEDGRVWSQWWNHMWHEYLTLGDKTFPDGTSVSAVTRSTDYLDVFAVDGDGLLRTAWWNANDGWDTRWLQVAGSKPFPPLTPVTSLSRNSDLMDLWLVDGDGLLNGVWWNGQWKDWYTLPGPKFPPRAPITSLSRNDDTMEVWGVDEHGAVWGIGWNGAWDPSNWTRIGTRTFPAGTRLAAASRDSDKTEIWAVDEHGEVWGCWWDQGWHDWYPIPGMTFPLGTPLAATSKRDGSHLEVYGVGADGRVYSAWFDGDNWNHPGDDGQPKYWFPRGGEKDRLPPLTPLAVQMRIFPRPFDLFMIDLFGVGADAGIHGLRYLQDWQPMYRLPVPVIKFQRPIESGGLAALGGWAGVNICVDGSVQWYGHAHDSGADGYDFGVAFYVRSDKKMIALSHNGSVSPSAREHNWEEIHPPSEALKGILTDFLGADPYMNMQYTSHIGQTLEGVVSMGLKWFVGSAAGDVLGGLVIFAGVELGSLIATGGFGAGAVVLENTLWLAGPGNSLLAVVAHAVAELAYDEKEIPEDAYRLINEKVFGGTLPAHGDIHLTNISGMTENGETRPFTFPAPIGGGIRINMGKAGFDDPVNSDKGKGGGTGLAIIPYETLVHELTHAWQIKWTGFAPSWFADAVSASIEGQDAYQYGPPGPRYASGFTIEGQAQIVSDWFNKYARNATDPKAGFEQLAGNEAVTDPYFRYIQDNIRTGDY